MATEEGWAIEVALERWGQRSGEWVSEVAMEEGWAIEVALERWGQRSGEWVSEVAMEEGWAIEVALERWGQRGGAWRCQLQQNFGEDFSAGVPGKSHRTLNTHSPHGQIALTSQETNNYSHAQLEPNPFGETKPDPYTLNNSQQATAVTRNL